MGLVEATDIKFKYQDKELYNNANFRILEGEHIVLVGPNGSGKSTFMNILAKNIIPDKGSVTWLPGIKYSYLDQQLKVYKDMPIKSYLYGVFEHLFELEKQMNEYYNSLSFHDESEYDKILNKAQAIQDTLDKENFYQINSKIGNIINGLGIDSNRLDDSLKNLSGGQKAKVFLAKMLLEESDVLLMDEPTNFLDREHIIWLSKYLNDFKGAFLVISHDVEFIKSIARVVYALENKTMIRYKGDYDFYLRERDIRNEHLIREYENQQKYIKQANQFIEAHIVRATSSRAAKQRRHQLEKLTILDKPQGELKIHFKFPYSKNLGEEVLKIENLSIGYDGPLLSPISFLIKKNEKVAILGKNGVGKSTLLKTLVGILKPLGGSFKFNPSADINYFSQEHEFKKEETAISYIRGFYPLLDDMTIRSRLALLGIKGDLVLKPMNELSGGEQTRVRIALMTFKKSNLLILDEPTNHLDKNTKEALWQAIDEFEGSVILVSHEKDFYDDLLDYEITFE